MKQIQVSAMVPAKQMEDGSTRAQIGPYTVAVNFGETAVESIQMFGDESVNSNAERQAAVTLQANMRAGMLRGETQEQLQTRLNTWKLGVAAAKVTVDPEQAFLAKYAAASPEERKAMRAKLEAAATAK